MSELEMVAKEHNLTDIENTFVGVHKAKGAPVVSAFEAFQDKFTGLRES